MRGPIVLKCVEMVQLWVKWGEQLLFHLLYRGISRRVNQPNEIAGSGVNELAGQLVRLLRTGQDCVQCIRFAFSADKEEYPPGCVNQRRS